MKLKKALVALAATGMVATPVAAQANTTAAAGTVKIVKADRKAAPVRAKHKAVGTPVIFIGVLSAAAAGVAVATSGKIKSNGA